MLFNTAHRLAFGCVIAFSLAAAPAWADDVSWNGFYVGAELGGGWSKQDWTYDNANYFNTIGPRVLGDSFGFHANGVIGGGLGGYNYQAGPWVLGVEVSAAGTGIKEKRPEAFFPTDVYESQIHMMTTGTARVGYAWDRWLLFGKGGYAGADVSLTITDPPSGIPADLNTWANGWTAGAGVEYRVWQDLSLGLTYDYAKLSIDNKTMSCPLCGTGVGAGAPVVSSDMQVQSLMLRLTYRLGQ